MKWLDRHTIQIMNILHIPKIVEMKLVFLLYYMLLKC